MRKSLSLYLIAISAIVLAVFFVSSNQSSRLIAQIPEIPPTSIETPNATGTTKNIDYNKVQITTKNVQSVISELDRPKEYYYETQSELFYSGGTTQYTRRKWARNGWQRVDVFSGENVSMHLIFGDGKTFIWRPGDTRYYQTSTGNFTADQSQMMMVYEDILKLTPEQIKDAKLIRYNDVDCIYVEAIKPNLGYKERFWVSVQNGLLLLGQTLKDNSMIYSVKATEISLSKQPDTTYMLPDGKLVFLQ